MTTFAQAAALLGVAGTAVIYGTDAARSCCAPADTRTLQQRWDVVIWPRAALQTIALTGLLVAALSP